MNKVQKQEILGFINNVANSNLKNANAVLEKIVNEKLKNRIALANKNLEVQE